MRRLSDVERSERVEQFARVALPVADFAAIMTQGRVQAVGEPADIEAALSEAYLGAA